MSGRGVADARCRPRLAGAPGTELHHSFGMWPLLIDDTTEAIEIEPGQRLVLGARGQAGWQGSSGDHHQRSCQWLVGLDREDVTDGPGQLVPQPVRVAGIDVRNRGTLRRLAYLAERRTQAADRGVSRAWANAACAAFMLQARARRRLDVPR